MPTSTIKSILGSSPVVIFAPGDFISGGPELSHQLADALSGRGIKARMLYTPIGKKFQTPEPYKKYNIEIIQFRDIPPGATIVIPEVYTGYLPRLKRFNVIIWWMSVDNYFKSDHWRFALDNGMMPWSFHNISKRPFPKHVTGHFVQSQYARQFLESNKIANIDHLGDYLNIDYINMAGSIDTAAPRRDIVVYNPQKGMEQTSQIFQYLKEGSAIPIQNMNRNQVIELLRSAKIYIDFGNHPGKDRIPREAAALGCCVITNRRGSAANRIDVPIDDAYKFDDTDPSFASPVANLIGKIFGDFPKHQRDFDGYRKMIMDEPRQFQYDVDRIFSSLADTREVRDPAVD